EQDIGGSSRHIGSSPQGNASSLLQSPCLCVSVVNRRYTTTLSKRPGTRMTFFGSPVMNLPIAGSAFAAASAASCVTSFGTSTLPRVLPPTCTTSSISSLTNSAGSNDGQ